CRQLLRRRMERHVDRIELVYGCKQITGTTDSRAKLETRAPDLPADLGADHAIVEVFLCGVGRGLRRLHFRSRVVDLLLPDGVLRQQRLEAGDGSLGVVEARDRASVGSIVLRRVDLVENLPFRDDGAFSEWPLDDDALDA